MSEGVLSQIHIHPVKSCRRIEVDSAEITEFGLANDRVWQVVTDEGVPITQRQTPILATVSTELIPGGLRIATPGQADVEVAHGGTADKQVRSLFGVKVPVADAGDEAAAWFSEVLDQPARLVGLGDGGGWSVPEKFQIFGEQSMHFGDASQVLVTTTSSLAWLQEQAREPFDMDRFRPNLVVDNDDPWVEDTWTKFEIGDASLETGMPWPRCAVPQIDQNTAERQKEPAVALRAHRWCANADSMPEPVRPILEGNGLFGIGCSIGPIGSVLSVGDTVNVSATGAPLIAAPTA